MRKEWGAERRQRQRGERPETGGKVIRETDRDRQKERKRERQRGKGRRQGEGEGETE